MMKSRNIAVVGSRSVGKSSMAVRYVDEHFIESYYPTIENQFSKVITYKNNQYSIEILDTAGQDEFSIMNDKHVIGIHGYLLVYSVTSRQSFELIEVIRDKILNAVGLDTLPMVLVGNKLDLNIQRQVDALEGKKLADKFGCKFYETSVKENVNISQAFEGLIDNIEKIHNPVVEKNDKCVIV